VGWEIDPEPSFTPRGNSSCFFNSILIKNVFRRIQVPGDYGRRYLIGVYNWSGNESIPRSFGDHLTCFCDHLAETWFCRGSPSVWPAHVSTYIEGTRETQVVLVQPPPPMSVSESQVLQHLCALEKSSSEFLRALHTFIRLDEEGEYSLNLQQPESARLVNFLDGVTPSLCATSFHLNRTFEPLSASGAGCYPSNRCAVPTLSSETAPHLRHITTFCHHHTRR